MLQVRRLGAEAGHRCAGHMVLLGPVALHDARLAGENSRSAGFLSDDAAHYRVRNTLLRGSTPNHVWLPHHAGASAVSIGEKSPRVVRPTTCQPSPPPV